ncbi:EAL domain-containing protein [Allorhizobium undicola]|uniref:EAL domain-containing protein n=1 Tax=Allorhizobium undicola TaxID=78527 RepID=UPI00055B4411|nr:EAL domain-containing protein [Allorhizobium undicola]
MSCKGCREGQEFEIPFSMAFQPIVDMRAGQVFGYEALVRGVNGEGAGSVLSQVTEKNRYAFDQQCRVRALELASHLRAAAPEALLSINFMPNAVYEPRACIRLTLATAMRLGFPLHNIIFEFTENEAMDTVHLLNILRTYKDMGFKTAIDDFGAGHSGLNLLAKFQPDIVKLDMDLVRDIDRDVARQKVMRHTVAMLKDLGVLPLCEGVETEAEMHTLCDLGVDHLQGYLLARPAFEAFEMPKQASRTAA